MIRTMTVGDWIRELKKLDVEQEVTASELEVLAVDLSPEIMKFLEKSLRESAPSSIHQGLSEFEIETVDDRGEMVFRLKNGSYRIMVEKI